MSRQKSIKQVPKSDSLNSQVLLIIGTLLVTIILVLGGLFFYNTQRKAYFNSQYEDMQTSFHSLLLAIQDQTPESTNMMERYSMNWLLFYQSYYDNPVDPYDHDINWRNSMNQINSRVVLVDEMVRKGYYEDAYSGLLDINNIWTDIINRNQADKNLS